MTSFAKLNAFLIFASFALFPPLSTQHVPLTEAELDALPAENLDKIIVIGAFPFSFNLPIPPLFAMLTHSSLPPSLPQPRKTIVSAPWAWSTPATSPEEPFGSDVLDILSRAGHTNLSSAEVDQ